MSASCICLLLLLTLDIQKFRPGIDSPRRVKLTHVWHSLLLYELIILVPLAFGNSLQLTSKELGDKCVVRSSTDVLCRDIVENSIGIVDHMNVALENTSCSAISVTLKHINFKDSKIPRNWLNNLKCKLKELTLENCQVNDISKGAFQSATFNGFNGTLTIVNSDLPVIKRGMFLGLSRLDTLAFRSYTNRYVLEVEESALDGLGSLTTLEMKSFIITSDALIHLTGKNGIPLPNLLTLDLGYNTIDSLPAYAFENAPRLKSLFLHGNTLKHVDVNAFRNNKAIVKLELSKNSLQTLSNGTFSALSQKSTIFLGTNNWNCECTLQWLKDLYMAYESVHINGSLRCEQGGLFEDVDFCSRSNDNPLHYSTMNCETSSTASSQSVESVHSVRVTIQNINFSLKVEELETEPLQVKIVIGNLSNRDGHFLMWFKSDNKSANGCVILHEDVVYISNLERNSTYTFNVIRQNETLVSPKATFGLTTNLSGSKERGF
ncbi:hypothetical protein RI129_005609 [Pyrocoelia pectoralis]|uniref:Uncharacterized protein n=1 Tax=Pyrocoelia pectoralis TaxID=417401 RepID=A0AAN7VHM0_9COLE